MTSNEFLRWVMTLFGFAMLPGAVAARDSAVAYSNLASATIPGYFRNASDTFVWDDLKLRGGGLLTRLSLVANNSRPTPQPGGVIDVEFRLSDGVRGGGNARLIGTIRIDLTGSTYPPGTRLVTADNLEHFGVVLPADATIYTGVRFRDPTDSMGVRTFEPPSIGASSAAYWLGNDSTARFFPVQGNFGWELWTKHLAAKVPSYQLIDFGTLGGRSSFSSDINNAGQVTGWSDTANGETHAFLYSDGQTIDLGTLGGTSSQGEDINDAGQITGWSSTATGEFRAFLYSDGAMTDLGTLGGGTSFGNVINNAGQVTGQSDTANGEFHGFLYGHGAMTDLGTLGGGSSAGLDINDDGQITGWSNTPTGDFHAFLYVDGSMIDLGTLGGGGSIGRQINNVGQVAGTSNTPSGEAHAFLYGDGRMTDIGTLGGRFSDRARLNKTGQLTGWSATSNEAGDVHAFLYGDGQMTDLGTLGGHSSHGISINRSGQVTGFAETASGATHAFIYRFDRMRDLNELICAPNVVLQSGSSINDRGQIAGQAFTASGDEHAVLVTPISSLFQALVESSKRVGEGKSLVAKSGHAGAYYSVRDKQASCSMLNSFVEDVDALRGNAFPDGLARRADR